MRNSTLTTSMFSGLDRTAAELGPLVQEIDGVRCPTVRASYQLADVIISRAQHYSELGQTQLPPNHPSMLLFGEATGTINGKVQYGTLLTGLEDMGPHYEALADFNDAFLGAIVNGRRVMSPSTSARFTHPIKANSGVANLNWGPVSVVHDYGQLSAVERAFVGRSVFEDLGCVGLRMAPISLEPVSETAMAIEGSRRHPDPWASRMKQI